MDNTMEERSWVGTFIPPAVLLGGMVLLCLAAQWLILQWPSFELMQSAAGVFLLILSGIAFYYSIRPYLTAGVAYPPLAQASLLITDGIYRISRNPVYLSMGGVFAGLAILLSSYLFVLAGAVFMVYVHYMLVLPEEAAFEAAHGETYRRYSVQVHRWL